MSPQLGGWGLNVDPGAGAFLIGGAPSFDWYVSPTGNDANNGSSGAPWLTLDRVVTELNKYAWLSQVRVYLAAGTYVGASFSGLNFLPQGRFALIAQTTTTLLSGTTIAGGTKVLLNTSALGAVNTWWRKSVRRRNQAGVMLDERSIVANTATSLQPATPFTSVPAVTDTFEIFEPAVTLDYSATGPTQPPAFWGWRTDTDHRSGSPNFSNQPVGGAHLVDVRISLGAAFRIELGGALYMKGVELTTTANNDVQVFNFSPYFMRCGIALIFTATTTLAFLGVTNDDMWCGNGLHVFAPNAGSGNYALRANGNFDGIFCVPTLYANLTAATVAPPFVIIRGGGFYGVGSSPAVSAGLGTCQLIYSPLSAPFCPIQCTCATGTAVLRVGGSAGNVQCRMFIDNINALQNAAANYVVFAEQNSYCEINFLNNYVAGSAPNTGIGVAAHTGAVVAFRGAPVITGATADTRIDFANPQPNSFYSALPITNPATPTGPGSRIMRMQ